jgi:hypothetical protein
LDLETAMIDGHFKCHACNAKGGDIISFHQQRYKLGFCHTLKALAERARGNETKFVMS